MKLSIAAILFYIYFANARTPAYNVCTKQDGGYSDWLKWSPCSVSCGKGHQTRHRYCDNPIAKHGGAPCDAPSTQRRTCNNGPCPPQGVIGDWRFSMCSRTCGGGRQTKYRHCHPPKGYSVHHQCFEDCPNNPITEIPCNTQKCHKSEVVTACTDCRQQAGNSVGHACRVDRSWCRNLSGGIKSMYPVSKEGGWFFLHCSADGPWCKPCSTKTLFYNAKCGQCEYSRDGDCTGTQKWRNSHDSYEDALDSIEQW